MPRESGATLLWEVNIVIIGNNVISSLVRLTVCLVSELACNTFVENHISPVLKRVDIIIGWSKK